MGSRTLQEAFVFDRIDFCVGGDIGKMASRAGQLGFRRIGTSFDNTLRENVVCRLAGIPSSPVKFPYVVVSDRINTSQPANVVTLANFSQAKERLKKYCKKGTGLEFSMNRARKMTGPDVAKWFVDIGQASAFCESTGCQLILSSGANAISEMISGRCFDAILKECGVDPDRHWQGMNIWLDTVLARRVTI
ncbi:MAG: hypothetical protein ACREAZ_08515 [Nitrososphaera sp.]